MQEKRISLRKVDSKRYHCEELGIFIDKELIGTGAGGSWQRTEWSMAIDGALVYAQRLGDCRAFLEAIYETAHLRVTTKRSKDQMKLTKIGLRRWRTDDGIEVWSERRMLPSGNVQVSRVHVDLAPEDASVPGVQVGSTIDDARRFIAAIPWRG